MLAGEVANSNVILWWVCDKCHSMYIRGLSAGEVPPAWVTCPLCQAHYYLPVWPIRSRDKEKPALVKGRYTLDDMLAVVEMGPTERE